MSVKDTVDVLLLDEEDEFGTDDDIPSAEIPRSHTASEVGSFSGGPFSGAAVVRLQGFDLQENPLLSGVPDLPGEIVTARSTVSLVRAQVGSMVVVVFEDSDRRRPIVIGALQERQAATDGPSAPAQVAAVRADGERLILSAEREIVLRCGDATISLTRAGKVVIKGKYIISRSTGYNRIKGAAVDIN
jgi:Domain of unknown function (DUF6484)